LLESPVVVTVSLPLVPKFAFDGLREFAVAFGFSLRAAARLVSRLGGLADCSESEHLFSMDCSLHALGCPLLVS
jgi:hypothetical protein